ncbi:MAG TPA: DUF2934 domain-containing protein [Gaiellaceae bacterium]|jgi:hypothetical protein|nr:DUF2934 domain-containing protein [Gaiellaceae bacterium]
MKSDVQLEHAEIAQRAYEIAQASGAARSDEENWLLAERELQAEKRGASAPKGPAKRRKAAVSERETASKAS